MLLDYPKTFSTHDTELSCTISFSCTSVNENLFEHCSKPWAGDGCCCCINVCYVLELSHKTFLPCIILQWCHESEGYSIIAMAILLITSIGICTVIVNHARSDIFICISKKLFVVADSWSAYREAMNWWTVVLFLYTARRFFGEWLDDQHPGLPQTEQFFLQFWSPIRDLLLLTNLRPTKCALG